MAEVLIALVIIGIIAAITVPSILQNTQRNEIVSKVKKVDSTLKQSAYKIAMNEGLPVNDFSSMNITSFYNAFLKTVNVSKACGGNQGCFSDTTYNLRGGVWASYNTSYMALVTNDGVSYHFGADCSSASNFGMTETEKNKCFGRIIIDVNGASKPNRFGYDTFIWVVISDEGIIPAGVHNNSADCKRNNNGITCAAKVLKEGKISYL